MSESEIQDQPYRPPGSMSVAEARDVSTKVDLPEVPVLVMILLTIVTLGFYDLVWFLRRRKALNQLWPERGIDGWLATLVAVSVGGFVAGLVMGILGAPGAPRPEWTYLITLARSVVMLILSFRVKWILEASYHDDVSGVFTFLFNIFYLQYKINRIQPKTADGSLLGLRQLKRSIA